MQCKQCGFKSPTDMKFCGQCGTSLMASCPKCKADNPGNFKFCGYCAEPLDSQHSEIKIPEVSQESSDNQGAERRQLTVLFCDLVGSSTLSEKTDPEDLRDIMRDYRHTCDEVIHRFKGHVAQYLGDGILTYFGFPHAHENDASRAVQTGLELIKAMVHLNIRLQQSMGINLSIRVGIHTGLVVVGEIGDGDKRSLALGQTPNIAARLQDLAKPNGIVISADTYRLVNNYYDCSSLGEHHLKGFSRPFTLYRVLREFESYQQILSPGSRGQTPLIGREQESALLLDRFSQANNGSGQVVLLSGEAGIGKSRLAQLLRDKIKDETHYFFESAGSAYYQNSYLHCASQLFREHLEFGSKSKPEEKLLELESFLEQHGLDLTQAVPLLAELLSISLPEDRYEPLQLAPVQKKQKTLENLLALGMAMSEKKTVVIIVEDLHWVDPTTLDLLSLFIDQTPTAKIFLLLTFRMEFSAPWITRSHMTQISVNRLTREQTAAMIKWIAKDKSLPPELVTEIINKTDGTPLFVEELTKMVLESNLVLEAEDHFKLASPLDSLAIPSTLQDSLMARLDRLGPNKELAQLSATLGREFSYSLLKAVAPKKEVRFENRLAHLVYSEVLYQKGLPPQAQYTFRHALVHELAYQSLLKKTRQKYHHLIALTLFEHFPEIVEENPELVAHHCTEAGDYQEATKYWLQAGKTAIGRSANTDAIVHLSRALDALKHLPESKAGFEYELSIQASLGLAYMLSYGYAAPEVEKAYARAYALCRNFGETSSIFPVLCGLWEYYVVRAEFDTAQKLASQQYNIAKSTTDHTFSMEAQRSMGGTLFWRGQLSEAYQYLKAGFKTQHQRRISTQTFSHDTEVANLANGSCVLWLQGFPAQALERAQQAVDLAHELSHPFSCAYAHAFCAFVHQLSGDQLGVKQEAEKIIEVSDTYEFGYWKTVGNMMLSQAMMVILQDFQYIQGYEKTLQQYKATGSSLALTYFHSLLAQSYCLMERYQQAYDIIDNTIDFMDSKNERFFEAELYRIKAEALLGMGRENTDKALQQLDLAIETARTQQATSLELRAVITASRVWCGQNQKEKALPSLDRVMSHYTEGFDTKDWLIADALRNAIRNGDTVLV
ncbi:MAG: AAA family ATPase [Gammaproteobacteria bacterium]|nr:AAA family ATPase [Gammaproteobacteria bacterium]MDH5802496.1 AAA family ATPase [Gammaproteobacteria bacterium]